MRYMPKEIYHIAWCLLMNAELDYGGKIKSPALNIITHIFMYLNGCPCEICRSYKKDLKVWLKKIRNPESFYRIKARRKRSKVEIRKEVCKTCPENKNCLLKKTPEVEGSCGQWYLAEQKAKQRGRK